MANPRDKFDQSKEKEEVGRNRRDDDFSNSRASASDLEDDDNRDMEDEDLSNEDRDTDY